MDRSPRLGLPFLSAGQAQKEFFHNEALQALDSLVAAAVEALPTDAPPETLVLGACYIVGTVPTGDWSDNPNFLATWTSGGWRFTQPIDGMSVLVRSADQWAVYRSGAWEFGTLRGSSLNIDGKQVVGSRAPAIAEPSGGGVIDLEARQALSALLSSLRQHGLVET